MNLWVRQKKSISFLRKILFLGGSYSVIVSQSVTQHVTWPVRQSDPNTFAVISHTCHQPPLSSGRKRRCCVQWVAWHPEQHSVTRCPECCWCWWRPSWRRTAPRRLKSCWPCRLTSAQVASIYCSLTTQQVKPIINIVIMRVTDYIIMKS